MIVTSKIRLDMAQPGNTNPVYVVQGDGNTRAVEAELLANGSSWTPDGGWEAAITYRKPDGTKGLYNLLDDGSSAITISGSTATVILAQQMMTVPGTVRAAIVFNNQRLDQLTSFPFLVSVARNQFAGAQQSEDYIRLQWLEDKLEERIAQLISTEEAVRAGAAAQEATIAAAAAQEQATAAENAAASANAAASRADTAAAGANAAKENADAAASTANTAAAAAQAVVDGIVPEVEQLRCDLTGITPDDAAVDGKPWTSRKIVDSLCQPFAETGNPVQCYPVEGYPLGVNIRIAPIQEGSGDPSPENIRPITGTVAVQIVHSNDSGSENTYDIALPDTVYGGTLDVETGVVTVTHWLGELTGAEDWAKAGNYLHVVFNPSGKSRTFGACTHFPFWDGVGDLDFISGNYVAHLGWALIVAGGIGAKYTVEEWKAYLTAQKEAGTPVQVCYGLKDTYTIHLTPQQISALSGVNTIYTDADGVIVTGAEDPKHTITELKNAILSLGGNI